MRWPFTDGFNSFWHVFFGVLAVKFSILWPGFIGYQLWHPIDGNTWIDIGEFLVGYFSARAFTDGYIYIPITRAYDVAYAR